MQALNVVSNRLTALINKPVCALSTYLRARLPGARVYCRLQINFTAIQIYVVIVYVD